MKDLKLEMECLTVYRLMIDESPDMVCVLTGDMEGKMLFANETMEKAFANPPADTLVGK